MLYSSADKHQYIGETSSLHLQGELNGDDVLRDVEREGCEQISGNFSCLEKRCWCVGEKRRLVK
jgi:hypothetical protein